MKTVSRYVLMEMMPSFLLSVSLLTFLLLINKVSLLLDLVLNRNVPLWETILLYLSLVPFILSLTIPMSMMLATLLAFGRLSSDMEVTAFKSSGVHLFRLIMPVMVFSFLLTLIMLFFNDKILPVANFTFKKVHFKMLKDQATIALREGVFIDQFAGYQFYIDHQDRNGLFSDVKMFDHWSTETTVQTTLAKTGRLETNQSTYQVYFHLNDGTICWDNKNFHTFNRLYFNHYNIRLKLENQFTHMTDVKKNFEEMNLNELSQELKNTSDPGQKTPIRNEFQKRISLPFACLAMAWFCAPLGLWTRSKGFIGFVLGLVVIFIYYLLFTLGQVLSGSNLVNPILGHWWANGILMIAGCFIYYIVIFENSAFRKSTPAITGSSQPISTR